MQYPTTYRFTSTTFHVCTDVVSFLFAQVCQVAVGVVGDLSRALEEDFIPISDDVMKLLLEHLQNNLIERSVKPHIFSCMGDIALAVGPFFERYMVYVMRMLEQASTIKAADLEEDEKYDYLNELRTSILEAYTGNVNIDVYMWWNGIWDVDIMVYVYIIYTNIM